MKKANAQADRAAVGGSGRPGGGDGGARATVPWKCETDQFGILDLPLPNNGTATVSGF